MREFHVTREESKTIGLIVERAEIYGIAPDPLNLRMDLEAVHSNGIPLNLRRLLDFPEFDFKHDICGIQNHIDRDSSSSGPILKEYFLPRCAQ